MNRTRWSKLLDGLLYASLTLLVWGVNALQRGMWQDDVQALGEAFRRSPPYHHMNGLFASGASPLRRLTLLPSAIAWATPHPIWALQILCAGIWLSQGLLAGWITGLLLPGRRWTRFTVICLTLTATSDFTTGSMVALAYNVAALLLLAAAGVALRWMDDGRVTSLALSSALLAGSLLTMDVAIPAIPFLALLLVWREGWRPARRLIVLGTVWGVVLIPIAIVEWRFLHDPAGYAAMALVPMTMRASIGRALKLWLDNFAPWRWAFARPQWYARPPAIIGTGSMAAGSLLAAFLFLVRARSKDDENAIDRGAGGMLAALFAVMALASNAVYARVWFSEMHYRTQILSRVWASMAIGILAAWACMRWPRLQWLAWTVVTAFVFFGTWGGIERQDFYLSAWRQHQHELASILREAPSLRPGTVVILRGTPPPDRYIATEADYLTQHWLRLLYGDPRLKTMRLDSRRGSGCQGTSSGLRCWREDQPKCRVGRGCLPVEFRFEDLVLMDYDTKSWSWHLVRSLQGDALDGGNERYRPESRIVMRPWTLQQRRLLLLDSK